MYVYYLPTYDKLLVSIIILQLPGDGYNR